MIRLYKTLKICTLLGCVLFLGGFLQMQDEQMDKGQYPKPRFPSYLKEARSVEEVMQGVRDLVRSGYTYEGFGFGVLNEGETALLVPTAESEEMIVEGIRRAALERGVTLQVVPDYELVGVSREDAVALLKARQTYTAEQGYMEGARWVQGFPDPEAAKQWLKERRPDLYQSFFPKERELSAKLQAIRSKLGGNSVGKALQEFMKEHPEVEGIFWGTGGGTGRRRALYPYDDKYLGMFTADNRWEALSQIGSYPADVWQLTEELTIESLVYVDKLQVTDPEGTNAWTDLSQVQAEKWGRGAYQRGHLYMFPNIATGRFAYSMVDYPAFQKEWLPREPIARLEGVIAGTAGGGFFPRMEVHWKDGFISEVKGGGLYGELFREFLEYPGINELVYPYHETPGFWYLYEIAWGTQPKYFRNPDHMMKGSLARERMASGVIHWGLGISVQHDPDAPIESKAWPDFTAKHNVPRGHNFHVRSYFADYKVHLRAADRWLTLMEKGHMSSLDNPEVRALASRYGDPDRILAEDWIPNIPGINAPGRYEDYAANPWKYAKATIDQVLAGDYEYFYPPVESGGNGK